MQEEQGEKTSSGLKKKHIALIAAILISSVIVITLSLMPLFKITVRGIFMAGGKESFVVNLWDWYYWNSPLGHGVQPALVRVAVGIGALSGFLYFIYTRIEKIVLSSKKPDDGIQGEESL